MFRLSRHVGFWVFPLALCMALSSPAQAQWKWRDKAGHTQYSDLPPPPGTPDADILQRPAAARKSAGPASAAGAASAPALAPKMVEPELEAKRKASEQEAAAKKKAEEDRNAANKSDNCARARAQLKAIDDGQRMSRMNAKGEREFLDDKGRADEAQRARGIIATDCK